MPRCTCTDPPHPVPPPWWVFVLGSLVGVALIFGWMAVLG